MARDTYLPKITLPRNMTDDEYVNIVYMVTEIIIHDTRSMRWADEIANKSSTGGFNNDLFDEIVENVVLGFDMMGMYDQGRNQIRDAIMSLTIGCMAKLTWENDRVVRTLDRYDLEDLEDMVIKYDKLLQAIDRETRGPRYDDRRNVRTSYRDDRYQNDRYRDDRFHRNESRGYRPRDPRSSNRASYDEFRERNGGHGGRRDSYRYGDRRRGDYSRPVRSSGVEEYSDDSKFLPSHQSDRFSRDTREIRREREVDTRQTRQVVSTGYRQTEKQREEKPTMREALERQQQGRPKLPAGVIEHKFQSGKIAKLVEPTHELAKELYERFYTSPPDNTVSEYWVELDENNKPIDYVKIYKGEVNVDRKRHETDQFFKAWMKNENKRDTDKTMKTLSMLQNSSLISEYEKMIELKLKEGIDSDEQLVETDQVIVLDGLYGCIEKINNKNILRDIVIDDFLEKNPDIKLTRNVLMNTPLNFNVVEFLKFNIPNSVDVQNALSIITTASTFGQVRDGLYALSCCISKHYVKELNTHITDWINKKCHRLFGSDRQFMDSFMADLEDANEYMESIGKLREFNSFVGELVTNVLKPYKTTDKEIREIMGYPDDVEESIMFGFISNVTCIPMDSEEYYQQCDDMGRLLVGKGEFVSGLAFGKISSYALPNNSETVVVTSDGMNMFVTKIDDKNYILSRN